MSPINVEIGRGPIEETPAEKISRHVFDATKEADILSEQTREMVNKMIVKVREVSPDCGRHSGRKEDEEYWYRVPELRFVMAVLMDDIGGVVRTDFLSVINRIRSGHSKAVATGVMTADGLFHPIRPDENGDKLDVIAYDKSGSEYPIVYGLQEDPKVVENEDVLYLGQSGKCEAGKIIFSFIDPIYGDFSVQGNGIEKRIQTQRQILNSLKRQFGAVEE